MLKQDVVPLKQGNLCIRLVASITAQIGTEIWNKLTLEAMNVLIS